MTVTALALTVLSVPLASPWQPVIDRIAPKVSYLADLGRGCGASLRFQHELAQMGYRVLHEGTECAPRFCKRTQEHLEAFEPAFELNPPAIE